MRRSRLLLVLLLLVVVNLPPAHAAWSDHRLDGDGVTETVPASTAGVDPTTVQVSLPAPVAEGGDDEAAAENADNPGEGPGAVEGAEAGEAESAGAMAGDQPVPEQGAATNDGE